MSALRIALATAAHLPDLADDDRVLHAALVERGFDARPIVWDGDADWSAFDVIVTRSIWDYFQKYARFLDWLQQIEASGACIYNPVTLQRWNSDKHYLVDLERAGVSITPTRVIEPDDACTLAAVAAETGWRRLVVKPTVGAAGYETWQADAPVSAEAEARFARQKSRMPVLVQQFLPDVRDGERSFVFINGAYTHCVLKRAVGEEFRVHIEYGGTVERIDPPPAQIAWAGSVVAAVEQPWMYARVDAVQDGRGGLVLMELEMLEPELFFAYNQSALDSFIAQITKPRPR